MTERTLFRTEAPELISEILLPGNYSIVRETPKVGGLTGGGYVVTWTEREQGASVNDQEEIYFQLFDNAGNEIGSAVHVNTTTTGAQNSNKIAALSDGSFVVIWQSEDQDGDGDGIFMQRFSSTGTALGSEIQVNTTTVGNQSGSEIAALAGGGYAVVWYDTTDNMDGTFDLNIRMQRFANDGTTVGSETTIQSETVPGDPIFGTSASYSYPVVTELTGGQLAIAWTRSDPTTDSIAQMVITDASGTPLSSVVEPEQTSDQGNTLPQQQVVALGNGNVLIVYSYSYDQTGSTGVGYGEIFGRIYNSSGVAQGAEFAIVSSAISRINAPQVTSDGNGGAIVAWREEEDAGGGQINMAQQIAQDGTLLGEAIQLFPNAYDNSPTDLALLSNGDIAAVTREFPRVLQSVLTIGDSSLFTSGNDVVDLGDGGSDVAALAGNDTITGGIDRDLIMGGSGMDTINAGGGDDAVDGGEDDDTINGEAGNDFIFGSGGDDTIDGGTENDTIDGGFGDDIINGGDHDDELIGGIGNDTINGGEGNDNIYGYRSSGLDIPPGEYDEDASFTNTLNGGGGDDRIFGAEGVDIMDGGAGRDTLNGGAGGDTMTGGEGSDNLYGLDGDDFIVGDTYETSPTMMGGFDLIRGGNGNDTIYGGFINAPNAADDWNLIEGNNGNDTIYGASGRDSIEGGEGADFIDGGGGSNDTSSYATSNAGVNVQLQYGVSTGGHATGDTLLRIENLTGSSHNDTLIGNPSANRLFGGNGGDTLKGLNGADEMYGEGGDDWIYVDNLDTIAEGGAGTDRLIVTNGNGVTNAVGVNGFEIVTGNTGDDTFDGTGATAALTLRGLSGNDVLTGGDFDDYIYGDAGADQLIGGDGLDRLFIDFEDTLIDAGGGTADRLIVQQLASAPGVSVDMAAANAENAFGNAGNDTFDGSTSTEDLSLYGRAGADVLIGGSGNDRLFGDNGTNVGDILNGGEGNDFLRGGTNGGGWAERDQFIFDDNWGNDRIFDFADNGFEKIDLSSIAGITGLADLTITDQPADATGPYALISYTDTIGGWSASIRVYDVAAADLGNADFVFV